MGMFWNNFESRSNFNSIFHDTGYICAFNIAASLPGYAGDREMYCATGSGAHGQGQSTQGQGTQGADIQVTQVTPAPSGHGHGRATETHSSTSMRPGFFYGGRVISTREGDRMATQQAQALKHVPVKGNSELFVNVS